MKTYTFHVSGTHCVACKILIEETLNEQSFVKSTRVNLKTETVEVVWVGIFRSLGFQKILSQTGEEVINIGIPKAEQPLQGVCGMEIYNFQVRFN